jgi:hypothetical protein
MSTRLNLFLEFLALAQSTVLNENDGITSVLIYPNWHFWFNKFKEKVLCNRRNNAFLSNVPLKFEIFLKEWHLKKHKKPFPSKINLKEH